MSTDRPESSLVSLTAVAAALTGWSQGTLGGPDFHARLSGALGAPIPVGPAVLPAPSPAHLSALRALLAARTRGELSDADLREGIADVLSDPSGAAASMLVEALGPGAPASPGPARATVMPELATPVAARPVGEGATRTPPEWRRDERGPVVPPTKAELAALGVVRSGKATRQALAATLVVAVLWLLGGLAVAAAALTALDGRRTWHVGDQALTLQAWWVWVAGAIPCALVLLRGMPRAVRGSR